jgi:hypothetical protein
MNRMRRFGHAPRAIAVSAFVLSLSLTALADRASASPVAVENEGCSTLAHARNESVQRLDEAWNGFRAELKGLMREARDVQHAARNGASTSLAFDVRDDLSDARAKLDAIRTRAHADIQSTAVLGSCTGSVAGGVSAPLASEVGAALDGGVWTMHPAGQGPKARASWTNRGELDANGTGTQAIYMQKMNDSASPGIAVVVIRGLSGQPVSALNGLSWDRPNAPASGSYCGTSPHWQISVISAGTATTVPFGSCFALSHTGPNAAGWQTDTCADFCLGGLPADATISSLAIIFEDGTDMGPGFVLLDNITVTTSTLGVHTWTSAADNARTPINGSETLARAGDVPGLSKAKEIVDQAIKDMQAVLNDVKSLVRQILPSAEAEDVVDATTVKHEQAGAEGNAGKRSENGQGKPADSVKRTDNDQGKPADSDKRTENEQVKPVNSGRRTESERGKPVSPGKPVGVVKATRR